MFEKFKEEKYFIDPDCEKIYVTAGLHEALARIICQEKGYNWSDYVSAADYLLKERGFIKVSNYSTKEFRYVQYGEKYQRSKKIRETAEFISSLLRIGLNTI